jgi:hypothetical protein
MIFDEHSSLTDRTHLGGRGVFRIAICKRYAASLHRRSGPSGASIARSADRRSRQCQPCALEMDEEEHVGGHQARPREDLRCEEVGARQQREASSTEFCPGRHPLPAPPAVTAQYVADRLIGDLISQVGERADNPVTTPGSISLAMQIVNSSTPLSIGGRPRRRGVAMHRIFQRTD